MAKNNYYAVKIGKNPGIYLSWEDCKTQIDGFSGAVYKGFISFGEAEDYLYGPTVENSFTDTESEAIAYVDGSNDKNSGRYGSGVVIYWNGIEAHGSFLGTDQSIASMWNIAGEIKAAEAAIRFCVENNITSVTIYHDYEGIARWAEGEWEAKQPGTQQYARYARLAKEHISIRFVHVKGHTGNIGNELADTLAKAAVFGIPVPDVEKAEAWEALYCPTDNVIKAY